VLLGAYLRALQWLLALVGIEFKTPVFLRGTAAANARHGTQETASNSRLSAWLGIGAEGEPSAVDPVALAKARVAALSR